MEVVNKYKIGDDDEGTYIGRGSIWGNPYPIGDDYTRDEAVVMFRRMMARKLAAKDPATVDMVMKLKDAQRLICYCKPKDCHGDIFKEIWDTIRDNKVSPLEGIRLWVKENGFSQGPSTDGINHINIYSKGATKLGRFLTNMSNIPVKTQHGVFESLEGYWYWLGTGMKHDVLRDANCFEAKKLGRSLEKVPNPDFTSYIKRSMRDKLEQYPRMLELFKKSTDVFTHYYFYGEADDRTVIFPPFDWITKEWELLRKEYRGELKYCIIAGSRTIEDEALVTRAVKASGFEFDVVVSGKAKGVDTLGEIYARKNFKWIKEKPADWDTHGKKAGILRNIEMGDLADMAVMIIKDGSKGSTQMKEYMESLGKPVYIMNI